MAYDLGTAHGTIELEYKGHPDVIKAQRDIDKTGDSSKKAERDLTKLKSAFASLGKGLATVGKFSTIGIGLVQAGAAAGNLVVQLLGVVPALTSILSLSAALPGLFAGMAASVGVLKAAFAGVGDAVKEAFSGDTDPAKFEKALAKLSPAAQGFAKAVKSAYPALHTFQQGLQDSFFSSAKLAGQVPRVVAKLASLKPQLTGLTTLFGETTRQVSNFALSGDSIEFLRKSIDRFKNALGLVTPTIVPILAGLRDVGTVGLPLLDKLGGAVSGVATKFADWLSAIAADGRLQAFIDTALTTLKTLGTIATNVGGILGTIFSTAAETGGGLLNTLASITGAFDTFLQSAQGKAAITGLFTGLAAVAQALSPVITTLAGALAGALGPALGQIATEVGPPLLQVVQALAPAFGPLAGAIANLVGAIAPLLPPVAALLGLLVQYSGTVLSAIAAELGPVISLFGGALLQAFTALQPVVGSFAAVLPQAAAAGAQLATAFAPLVPLIVQLATTFANSLVPVMPQLIAAIGQLIPPAVQLATTLSGQLQTALTQIIPLIPGLVNALVQIVPVIVQAEIFVLRLVNAFFTFGQSISNTITSVVGFISRLAAGFTGGLTAAYNAIVGVGATIISFFTSLPGRIGAALSALPGLLRTQGSAAIKSLAFSFGAGIGTVISFAARLPGQVGSALGSLGSTIVGIASRAWSSARAAFSAGVSAAVSFARQLPGRAASAISALPGQLAGVASRAWAAARNAFSAGVSNVVAAARALPGRVTGALSGLGGLLVSAGRDIVLGLAHGISGAVGAAVSAAVSVGKQVIGGIKSTLNINSPSRVMITLGRYITQGLAQGMTGTIKQIQAASNKLANAVKDAFSDKLIKRSQKNSVLAILSKSTKQLTALVNKSNTVASKLKTAQANLKAVQKDYVDAYYDAKGKVLDSFNVVTDGQNFINLDLTKERFKDAVAQAKQFAADINTLAKRGLNKDLLAQLTDAGAEQGSTAARALATATDAQLKEFNSLQGQLETAAQSTGKATQSALYGAGVQAAQGIVKGLQSQQKAIDKQMDAIANSMIKAIKKALKIKSPSREMFKLGAFISEGLANGITAMRGMVVDAAKSLATASVLPTVALGANRAVAGATAGATGTVATGTTVNFAQTVNALPGQDAKQVSDYALTKLRLALTTGVGAVNLASPTLLPAGA